MRLDVARRLLGMLVPLAPLMAVSVGSRVVNQGLGVAIPSLAAAGVVAVGSGSDLGPLIGLIAALALVKGTFRYVEQFTGHAVSFRLLADLRTETYRRLVPLAPAGLDDDRSGDLVARVLGDVDRVEPFYAHTIAPLVSAVVVPVLTIVGLAVWVDPAVALAFAPFPLLAALALPWFRLGRVADLSSASRAASGELAAELGDAVQGARDLAVFDAEEQAVSRLACMSAEAGDIRKRLARVASGRSVLGDLLSGGAFLTVAAVGAGRLGAGAVELGGLAAAVAVSWVVMAPARALEEVVPDLEQALAAAARLFELADRPPAVEPVAAGGETVGDGSLSMTGVTVSVGKSRHTALERVDLHVDAGHYVAVVGPSGSGKSTLVELLLRFRDPESGTVEVGGADVRAVAPGDLLAAVALVPQRPDIFYGTVADNLRIARPGAADAELWEVLAAVDLRSWAEGLDLGLDTPVGERGETLSGGQRQRIAIARALLRVSHVLILDEATSELDVATEGRVMSSVTADRQGRTIVVVAHRLDTVRHADEILVMDRGKVVERGRHDDLTRTGGVYAGLWQRHLDGLVV